MGDITIVRDIELFEKNARWSIQCEPVTRNWKTASPEMQYAFILLWTIVFDIIWAWKNFTTHKKKQQREIHNLENFHIHFLIATGCTSTWMSPIPSDYDCICFVPLLWRHHCYLDMFMFPYLLANWPSVAYVPPFDFPLHTPSRFCAVFSRLPIWQPFQRIENTYKLHSNKFRLKIKRSPVLALVHSLNPGHATATKIKYEIEHLWHLI